jgi:hypothetical protein
LGWWGSVIFLGKVITTEVFFHYLDDILITNYFLKSFCFSSDSGTKDFDSGKFDIFRFIGFETAFEGFKTEGYSWFSIRGVREFFSLFFGFGVEDF